MRICEAGILVKGDNVLLRSRSKAAALYPNTWDVFGGHCEPGESVEQTLVRELNEELGVQPLRYVALGMFDEPNPTVYGPGEYHFFAVYEWRGEPANLGDEHQTIEWFRVTDA